MTNWLAIKMLFDRIPLLYGSGIILRKFKKIRCGPSTCGCFFPFPSMVFLWFRELVTPLWLFLFFFLLVVLLRRSSVKDALMSAFFDEASLQQYLKSKISHMVSGANLDERIKSFLNNPAFESIIDRKLDSLAQRPEGVLCAFLLLSPVSLPLSLPSRP